MHGWSRFFVFAALFVIISGAASTAFGDEAPSQQEADQQIATGEQADRSYDRLGVEEPTTRARAGLVAGQTFHGFVLGMQACIMVECDGPRAWTSALTLGTGAGLGGSLLATQQQQVTPGMARAVNHGALWGGVLSFLGASALELEVGPAVGTMMASQLFGVAAGYSLWELLGPTSGDVLLTTLGAVTAMFYYPMITEGVLDLRQDDGPLFAGMAVSAVAGGVGTAFVARQFPMSTGRVSLIGAGGLLGGLAGIAVPVMIAGDQLGPEGAMAGIIVGNLAGYVTAGYLTRDWDDEEEFQPRSVGVTVEPTPEFDGMVGSVTGRW